MNNKINLIFLSSSEFGLPVLKKLSKDGRFLISSVITIPDKPKGRHFKIEASPIKKGALNLGIKIFEVDSFKDQKWKEEIIKQKPDIMIMASFGKIIPENILKIPPFGILNIHPSLLPKFRGPSPIQSAILEGETETGVTIILTDEKMDHGPILKIFNFPVFIKITADGQFSIFNLGYKKLHNKLAELGAEIIGDAAVDWIDGKIKPVLQDESKATYTKKIKKEDGLIDWNEPAEIIARTIRAFEIWPTCYFFIKKNDKIFRIQILEAETVDNSDLTNKKIGQFFKLSGDLAIQTGQGILKIIKLKPEGKKIITGKEFIRGYLEK